MTRKSFSRTVKLTTASFMAVLFGFPGIALADQASIHNTGPDSYNKIEFSDKLECEVENNNNVSAINKVDQNAQTGDAVVGSSDWHRYDPVAWAAQGHSYDEWESAVGAYMAQNKGKWKNEWGGHGRGGNTSGGSARSGDATNISSNQTTISIDNSDACDFGDHDRSRRSRPDLDHPSSKDKSKSGSTLGKSSYDQPSRKAGKGGVGGALGGVSYGGYGERGMYGPSSGGAANGGVSAYYPTKSGGAGGPGGGKGGGGHRGDHGKHDKGSDYPVNDYSINHTGPDSYNKISHQTSSHTDIKNTSNVNVINISKQSASSGNATVSGNTKAGSAGSGGAHNSSGNSTGAGIKN